MAALLMSDVQPTAYENSARPHTLTCCSLAAIASCTKVGRGPVAMLRVHEVRYLMERWPCLWAPQHGPSVEQQTAHSLTGSLVKSETELDSGPGSASIILMGL